MENRIKHRKTGGNRGELEKQEKTARIKENIEENTGKQKESGENIIKHWKTGKKHRKTRGNRGKRRKTPQNREKHSKI